MNKRSKTRITKMGMLAERRAIAIKRLLSQQVKPIGYKPTDNEIQDARMRWEALQHQL